MPSHMRTAIAERTEWTEKEYLRRSNDGLGRQTLEMLLPLVEHGPECSKSCNLFDHDLFELLRNKHTQNAVLSQFWTEVTTTPPWVDWDQIERGQRFFHRFAIAILSSFAFQGFIGEVSAAPPGLLEILAFGGGLSPPSVIGRLRRTLAWYEKFTRSRESVQIGGEGHRSTIRVRLLHAHVGGNSSRRSCDDVSSSPQGSISALDSIFTITFFCCNPLWLYLPQIGIFPRAQEINDFVALHRYLAYLMGIPHNRFSTVYKAKITMEYFLGADQPPNEESKKLARTFVGRLASELPFDRGISERFVEASCRTFNSSSICDQIGLGSPGSVYYIPIITARWLLGMLAAGQRKWSFFDHWVAERNHHLLVWMVGEESQKSTETDQQRRSKVKFGTRRLFASLNHIIREPYLQTWFVALLALSAVVSLVF